MFTKAVFILIAVALKHITVVNNSKNNLRTTALMPAHCTFESRKISIIIELPDSRGLKHLERHWISRNKEAKIKSKESFTCHVNPEICLNFPCPVFGTTSVAACIFKSHPVDIQCVFFYAKVQSIFAPVDLWWRISLHIAFNCKGRV